MRHYLSSIARTFRSWLLREAKSEIRASQQLLWVTSKLKQPIPSTAASLQPVTINWIVNDIIINNRTNIVELGAGTSTQIIAKAIELLQVEHPIKFTSVEENEEWAKLVQKSIEREGSAASAQVVPVSRKQGPGGFWYDEEALSALIDRPVDLLIVDGPAIRNIKQATDRSRVMDFFKDRMADSHTIFIDDTSRPAERKLATAWGQISGSKPTYLNAYLAVIQAGKGFSSKPN